MPGQEPYLHPYDVLAHPKRRRILDSLEEGPLTYTELMRRSGVDDSGIFAYHLGVLSRYIQHQEDAYSLNFEGRMLASGLRDFEEKAFGLMGDAIFSGQVDATGLMKMVYSIRVSAMTPMGDLLGKSFESGFDEKMANAALKARLKQLGEKVGDSFPQASASFEGKALVMTFEHERQGFELKDEWLVEKSSPDMMSQGADDFFKVPVTGMHFRAAGSTVYPRNAIVEKEFLDVKALEELGVEIYEYSRAGNNLRWRVMKGPSLCIGESRLVGRDGFTREILELENHVSVKKPSASEAERLGQELPKIVGGKTRFRVP